MASARPFLLIDCDDSRRAELSALLELQGDAVRAHSCDARVTAELAAGASLAIVALDGAVDLERLRALRALAPELPLLALVPGLDRASRLRCLNAGVDEVAALPVDPLELRVRVRAMLAAAAAPELERALLVREDRALTLRTLASATTHDLANMSVRLQCAVSELEDAGAPVAPLVELAAELGRHVRALGALVRDAQPQPAAPWEVAPEARRILERLVRAGPLREAELVIRDRSEGAVVDAPREHLEQLVANLVSGALDAQAHLPADERAVSLELDARDGKLAIRVTPLLPWTVNPARPRSAPRPLGLGPRAVQALARACNGTCQLERESGGRTVLAVILPRADAAQPAVAAQAAQG